MVAARHPPALPLPTDEEQRLSDRLAQVIRAEIAARGTLPFERFMELALYAPGLGYYAAGKEKFGEGGDYVTAPELSPLFGQCLARTAAEVLTQISGGDILEVGAGSGQLAVDLLNELAALDELPRHYYVLDLSPDLRARQSQTIKQKAPAFHERVRWLDALPQSGFRGLILGNELLDAMPVTRIRVNAGRAQELHVTWSGERFAWATSDARETVSARIAGLELPDGYEFEIGFPAEAWVRTAGEILAAGAVLLIDYGFPRAEFYHVQRAGGTLMCHYRHRVHSDPLILVGLQDITAHVDFSAIAEAGIDSGLELLGYTSQAAFLLGSGLEALAARSDPNDARKHLELTQQIKKLTLPHEMGELFKVIALGRGINSLSAFALQDRRGRL